MYNSIRTSNMGRSVKLCIKSGGCRGKLELEMWKKRKEVSGGLFVRYLRVPDLPHDVGRKDASAKFRFRPRGPRQMLLDLPV